MSLNIWDIPMLFPLWVRQITIHLVHTQQAKLQPPGQLPRSAKLAPALHNAAQLLGDGGFWCRRSKRTAVWVSNQPNGPETLYRTRQKHRKTMTKQTSRRKGEGTLSWEKAQPKNSDLLHVWPLFEVSAGHIVKWCMQQKQHAHWINDSEKGVRIKSPLFSILRAAQYLFFISLQNLHAGAEHKDTCRCNGWMV